MLRTPAGKPDTTARHVLQVLAEHADKDGTGAHPSLLRVQYRTGYDRRTIQRALRRLETAELIKRDGSVNGRTSWRLALDKHRPAGDWVDLEAGEEADRAAAAERSRRSRARNVTDSASAPVTHSASMTEDVTHSASARHAFEVRDVTHSASARHALSAAQTVLQPSLEPSFNHSEPPSESPRPESNGRATPSRKKKTERTPEQQAAFDAADAIAHGWWDRACPERGIPVTGKRKFPGFRTFLAEFLDEGVTETELKHALADCGVAWPARGQLERAITQRRGRNPSRPVNGHAAWTNPQDPSVYDADL